MVPEGPYGDEESWTSDQPLDDNEHDAANPWENFEYYQESGYDLDPWTNYPGYGVAYSQRQVQRQPPRRGPPDQADRLIPEGWECEYCEFCHLQQGDLRVVPLPPLGLRIGRKDLPRPAGRKGQEVPVRPADPVSPPGQPVLRRQGAMDG